MLDGDWIDLDVIAGWGLEGMDPDGDVDWKGRRLEESRDVNWKRRRCWMGIRREVDAGCSCWMGIGRGVLLVLYDLDDDVVVVVERGRGSSIAGRK